jgi:hypothetical protein
VTASFRALRDNKVGTGRLLPSRVLSGADQCCHEDIMSMRARDQLGGRRSERARDEPDRMLERDVEQAARGFRCDADRSALDGDIRRQFRNLVARQQVADEGFMFGRERLRSSVTVS